MDSIDRIDRRLEVLARERMAQLKPGFSATPDGKLCYAHPGDGVGSGHSHRKSDYRGVDPAAAEAEWVKEPFKVGDRVRVKAGVESRYYASGNVGVVDMVRARWDDARVSFYLGQRGLDTGCDAFWWVMQNNLEHLPTFDSMTEPLQVGDTVRVVLEYSQYGHVGQVLFTETPGRTYRDGDCFVRVEGIDSPFVRRSSLELLSRPT